MTILLTSLTTANLLPAWIGSSSTSPPFTRSVRPTCQAATSSSTSLANKPSFSVAKTDPGAVAPGSEPGKYRPPRPFSIVDARSGHRAGVTFGRGATVCGRAGLTSEQTNSGRESDSPQPIRLRGVTLDGRRQLVSYRGEQAELTTRETELLAYLMRHPDQYFTAEQLVRRAWQAAKLSPEELRIYVHRLPCKLIGRQWLGYRLEVEPSGTARLWRPVHDSLLVAYRWLQRGGRRRSVGS